MSVLPQSIPDEAALEDLLSEPSEALIEMMKRLEGDILILGVAGKMGITLARMAKRAVEAAGARKQVLGAARFSEPGAREKLEAAGVRAITCDLLDRKAVAKLPPVDNIVFMAGRKFGAQGALELTWAMNVLMPAIVAERFSSSRIAAFSTGCVYPFVSPAQGGCTEDEPPAPIGEYAQSCLGRERAYAYYSAANKTPVCLIRLNYAIDLRYGVLHDIAHKVWSGEPLDVSMGWLNGIWQGDANNQSLLCLEQCASPANVLNITGPEIVSVRWVAQEFGRLMKRAPILVGTEAETAYLNNASRAMALFGYPRVPISVLIQWTDGWIRSGGASLNKPTHFEVRDGKY
jgi:nucleoside-diphosphate-sugar epimerase